MQARTPIPSLQLNLLLWALVALGAGLLSVLPASVFDGEPSTSPATLGPTSRVAYIEFGREADTLWLASATHPSKRHKGLRIAHAAEFGVVPSLAPDRRSFAYTVLPAGTSAPTPQTPAKLWLADIESAAQPRQLARGVDLLVAPVWSPSGDALVFRRSGDYRLFLLDVASGQERQLVAGEGAALFPVAFSPDASLLHYVRVTNAGSHLNGLELATGNDRSLAKLSDGLTRDWRLSPAGDRLVYLVMNLDSSRTTSRAFVLDLNNGSVSGVGTENDTYSPVWTAGGELALGSLSDAGEGRGGIVTFSDNGLARSATPGKGFDAPLSFAPTGDWLAARNFDGSSLFSPGRERLQIVGTDGTRKNITNGEVTFLGWIDP